MAERNIAFPDDDDPLNRLREINELIEQVKAERLRVEKRFPPQPIIPEFTLAEYFAIEAASERRWEFRDGQVVCMSGGRKEHHLIQSNVVASLARGLKGCHVFTGDTAVATQSPNFPYCYPDVSVACNPQFSRHEVVGHDLLINPVLIVEVLSPTSKDYDRGNKFDLYKAIPGFAEYLLIEPNAPRITHWTKREGVWFAREVTEGVLRLVSIECEMHIADVYEGVTP